MKNCIINVSDGIHTLGQKRLKGSIESTGFDGDILFWSNKFPPDSPSQNDAPWGFKVYAFKYAFEKGYDNVLWIDSNGIVIRDLLPLFQTISDTGYFFHSQFVASVAEWSSDITLSNMGLERTQVRHTPEISAFCIGLSRTHPAARKFFADWKQYCDDGVSFRGLTRPDWRESLTNDKQQVSQDDFVHGHRHDQTVASILAHKYRLSLDSKSILNYLVTKKDLKHIYRKVIPSSVLVLQARDIKTSSYIWKVDEFNNHTGLKKYYHFAVAPIVSYLREFKILAKRMVFALYK